MAVSIVRTFVLAFLLMTVSLDAHADIVDGLVAYLPLDEGSGTLTADVTGNGHTGTLVNNPLWSTGYLGAALTFNGSNNYVDLAGESAFDFTTAFSVSFWMKIDGYRNPWAALVQKADSAWGISRNSGGNSVTFTTFQTDGGVDDLFAVTNVSDGQWHHVVAVKTSTQKLIYIDGVLDAAKNYAHTVITNNYNVRLGMNQQYSPAYYDGALDEVRIYNRALTSQEVTALYNQ